MCDHYDEILQEDHRHYVIAPDLNNCVLCVSEENGPMTQEQIAQYMGLSKMRISQILKSAQKKMSIRIKLLENKKYFTNS